MTLARFSSRYPSFFDRFLEGDMMDWSNSNFSPANTNLPAVNIKENKDEFKIEVAAPGMKKDNFKVNYDNGSLSISSEASMEVQEDEKYSRREFSYQSFLRTFNISQELVDGDKINAKYSDGILNITLPKREEIKPKPAREISIL